MNNGIDISQKYPVQAKNTAVNKKGTFKSWIMRCLIFSISIIIGLLLGEGIIRLLYKNKMVLYPRYHTNAEYGSYKIRKIRPNMSFIHTSVDGTFHFKTNNKGFRNDKDINYEKPAGELRVLSLGDSHTQGYEVNQEETFSNVAEATLNKSGIKSTVINAGVSGFSTEEELVFLENEGYKYKPDYVVVGVYSNDFEDNVRCKIFELKDDSLVTRNHEYLPGVSIQNKLYNFWLFRYLGEHSYLYGFAFNTIWEGYQKRSMNAAKEKQTEYAVAMTKNTSMSEELMKKLIDRMYNFSRSHKIKLIIVDIPQFTDKRLIFSSFPDNMLTEVKRSCDTLFNYDSMVHDYNKLSLFHVKHGHRHITAQVHNLLGHKIAEYILSDYSRSGIVNK